MRCFWVIIINYVFVLNITCTICTEVDSLSWNRHEVSESHSVISDSLQPHGLYSPWNSPGQNTGAGSLCLLQGSSQPRDRIWVSRIAGEFFISWATRILQWVAYPFSSGSSQPRNQTSFFCNAGGFFTRWAIREDKYHILTHIYGI